MINGDLKSLLLLWENLAYNRRYSRFITEKDIHTFRLRAESEGLAFLTRVLPFLGKALDTFHSTNEWKAPSQFKTDRDGIPHFLGTAVRLAIDGNSVAVDCVRQLSYVFYKLEVPYDEQLVDQFLDQFIRTDQELLSVALDSQVPIRLSSIEGRERIISPRVLVDEMRGLISRILLYSDPREIRPCHGSGATACHTPNQDKWHKLRYYPKLDAVFDYPTYFYFSATHVADELDKLELSIVREPKARVCLVPKDSRGPRVISCEPAELMYIQQGLMRKLYDTIETNHYTRGQINFTDQRVNRQLARTGSITGEFATLDLKDASDRVSLDLVRSVFPPDWVECLEACRSEETVLPNGMVVKLNKFAPMGSACCFPVEALVFWACAVATTRYMGGRKLPVYVYGDDIICDATQASDIMVGLEAIGLLVNRTKSFVTGPFRESCGGDYHYGVDVTPIRVRKVLSKSSTGLETCADLANEIIAKFGYEDSHSVIRVIEDTVGYLYPRTELSLPATIQVTPGASNDVVFRRRYNKHLQRYEHRILTLRSPVIQKRPPSWGELLRKELSREKAQATVHYENRLAITNARCEPGQYAAAGPPIKTWTWTWLG
jgi:hypothetical protein